MEVLIENRQSRHRLSAQKIQTTARRILSALGYPDEAQLSILIVDDDQIAELNLTYLNHAGPTNVISFPMQEGQFAGITPDLLGDVVISADTAHREAADAGMAMAIRFDQLLIHGILHLAGYDHVNSEEEAAVMERKSDELMELIGKED
ncbi:endoribonuclease YbeY [Desulfosarcina alkanivorans]|uniref:Endoribonuclease YbeY n=1 Tax=Desulfosarcina alkanivorans TaxID=571177 RepID=A0A5K7YES5_9BACT|nr:endoribonuclease YbeY [Desulfosarcina alkanivorans]